MINASWKLRGKVFFLKDRNFYRLNKRSMPRSSEDIIFAVFAVTLRKTSLAHNNFSLQKYLNRCDLHIVETSRKKILFEERAYYLLNKRPMTKREAKFVKPGLPIFSKIVRKRFVTVQNRTVVMDKSEFVRILSEVSINVTSKFCVLPLEGLKTKGRSSKC